MTRKKQPWMTKPERNFVAQANHLDDLLADGKIDAAYHERAIDELKADLAAEMMALEREG